MSGRRVPPSVLARAGVPASHGGAVAVRPRLRGWSHAAAIPLAALGAWAVVAAADPRDVGARVTTAVFAACLVGLYTASTLYHLPPWREHVRRVFGRIDRAMIQLFIAASFTPMAYHALSGAWRTWSLVVAWVIAGVGVLLSALPVELPRWLGAVGSLAAGWVFVVPLTRMMLALPWQGTGLIVLGGVLYTLGAVVWARKWPDPWPRWFGFHEVFHLLVVAASVAHYLAIWRYALPLA